MSESNHKRSSRRGMLLAIAACALLLNGAATAAEPGPQARFDLAVQALQANRLNTARRLLNALLADEPTLHRARLELARANYLAADFAGARREAERVLADPNVPAPVRASVLAFLAQVREDEQAFARRHRWQPTLYLGGMYDSNVNFGVSRDIIDIGGVPFRVLDNSRARGDGAAVIDASLLHTYNPGKRFDSGEHTGFFVWESQASGYYRAYFSENDFNLAVATLRTGPNWFVPGHWRAGLGLQGDQVWLGNSALATYGSLNPSASWQFDGQVELTVEGILSVRDYSRDRDRGRDGWYASGGLRAGRTFADGRWGLQAGAAWFSFDADESRFSNKGPDLFVGGVWQPWTGGSLFARAGYRKFDFNGVEPGFGFGRDDDEYRVITGLSHVFRGGVLAGWSLLAEWSYTDNRSNVDIYDYDRNQASMGLSRSF